MDVSQQLLFFFSALGGFNGLLLAGYFFFTAPNNSNRFLSLMLLMVSIRIVKSTFFYFDPNLAKVYLQLGLTAYFFVGPFLYFYVMSKLGREHTLLPWKIHLSVPAIVLVSVGIFYPYQDNPDVWFQILRLTQYQWPIYIGFSAYCARNIIKDFFKKPKASDETSIWVVSVVIGNLVIWFTHFTAYYTSYILGALSFSFVLYLTILAIIFHYKKRMDRANIKYIDKKITTETAAPILEKLSGLMNEHSLYTDANLTLADVAKKMKISAQHLSQLLNDNLNKSFTSYINEYRIELAKKKLTGEKQLKMEVIVEQCGFNSQSTFYSAFKKLTGTTPAQYRKSAV